MKKISLDNVIDVLNEVSIALREVRKVAEEEKTYASDRKIADIEMFTQSIKTMEDSINNNKKVISLLPLGSFEIKYSNNILKLMEEVR